MIAYESVPNKGKIVMCMIVSRNIGFVAELQIVILHFNLYISKIYQSIVNWIEACKLLIVVFHIQ